MIGSGKPMCDDLQERGMLTVEHRPRSSATYPNHLQREAEAGKCEPLDTPSVEEADALLKRFPVNALTP